MSVNKIFNLIFNVSRSVCVHFIFKIFFYCFQPNHTRRRARDIPKNYNVSDSNDEASVSLQNLEEIQNMK